MCPQNTDLARNVMSDINLLVIEKHAIDSLDGAISSFGGLVMNESISLGATMFVCSNFAGQHIAKGGESIMESLEYLSIIEFLLLEVSWWSPCYQFVHPGS